MKCLLFVLFLFSGIQSAFALDVYNESDWGNIDPSEVDYVYDNNDGLAYSCDTDCGNVSKFRYPCPTFSNPGRKCWGKNHVKYAACESDKAIACRLMSAIENKALTLALSGKENETIQDRSDCIVIVTAGLAVWGTAQGGPWVGLAAGATGGAAASLACRKAFPL